MSDHIDVGLGLIVEFEAVLTPHPDCEWSEALQKVRNLGMTILEADEEARTIKVLDTAKQRSGLSG